MDNTVTPVGGAQSVNQASGAEKALASRSDQRQSRETGVPGHSSFDSVELSQGSGRSEAYAKFMVNSKTGVVSIKIIDSKTDEVIREIPPEDVVQIAEELQSYLKARWKGRG